MSRSENAGLHSGGLRYERHGALEDVLEWVSRDLPEPGPGEALVAMRAAAVHYSDLGLINGTYGRKRGLPAIAGREGVGEIVVLGTGSHGVAPGSLVRMPPEAGVWQEAMVAKVEDLVPIPAGVPLEQAAMAFINPPTAWCLLHEFVKLTPGDWIIQNAGTSAVGVLVTQWARLQGLNVVSVVRDAAQAEKLKAQGAAVVVAEDSGYEKDALALTGGAPLKLALNSVGGESAGRLCRVVAKGAVVVTYGGVTAEPMRFPTRYLIFNDIALRGFWLDAWVHTQPTTAVQALWSQGLELLRAGVLHQPVAASYALAEWRAGLDHAFRAGRGGKVILTSAWRP
jgi:NADPH:quinone reductase-like Zn-dependent oxidoreductase